MQMTGKAAAFESSLCTSTPASVVNLPIRNRTAQLEDVARPEAVCCKHQLEGTPWSADVRQCQSSQVKDSTKIHRGS